MNQCWLTVHLTHWGRVTHICVSKLTIIGSDNGLSPDRRQAIIRTNDGLLLIGPLRTSFSEILIEILTFSFNEMRLNVSSAKRRPFCLGLNVLTLGNHISLKFELWTDYCHISKRQWKCRLCNGDILSGPQCVNTLRPRQNGRHFPDDIFKWIFLNENVWISIHISLVCS